MKHWEDITWLQLHKSKSKQKQEKKASVMVSLVQLHDYSWQGKVIGLLLSCIVRTHISAPYS